MHILTTERLIIEQAALDDAAFFLELLNSPTWIQYIGDRGMKSIDESAKYIQDKLINSYQENGYGLYKMSLKENNNPIGICGFVKRNYLDDADIGFAILPPYEGKGYSFEAANAMMKYGKSNLNLDPILAVTTKNNIKSRNLLSKIGLSEIGKITPKNSNMEFLLFSNQSE